MVMKRPTSEGAVPEVLVSFPSGERDRITIIEQTAEDRLGTDGKCLRKKTIGGHFEKNLAPKKTQIFFCRKPQFSTIFE